MLGLITGVRRALLLSGLVGLSAFSAVGERFSAGPRSTVTPEIMAQNVSHSLETVPKVDLKRYMGLWYEIARYDNSFQRGLVAVTAEYTLREDGTVGVENIGRVKKFEGREKLLRGTAWVKCEHNTKLTVQFLWPFTAPYWIIDLDEDYQWAVVGQPSRQYLWILSRTKQMDPETLEGILKRLRAQSYDPSLLKMTPQPAG